MSRGRHITIVLPVLNEADNLRVVLSEIEKAMAPLHYSWDAIFVDDGSADSTVSVLAELERTHAHVKVLTFSRNFGHQAAITAGLDAATGDAVVLMDSDLQHPPALLPQLLVAWENGFEVVYTIRDNTEGAGANKKLPSRIFYGLFNSLSETRIPANAADFRLLDREAVNAIKGLRERARFLRGLTSWIGFRQTGIHYVAAPRRSGTSSYDSARMVRLAVDAVTSMSTMPLRLCLVTGFLVSALAFAYMVYVIMAWELTHKAITGWSSLMIGLLFLGGIQLTTIGIVGIYVAKVYDEVKQRPLYVLREPHASRDSWNEKRTD